MRTGPRFATTLAYRRPIRTFPVSGQSDPNLPPEPTATTTTTPAPIPPPSAVAGAIVLQPGQIITTQRAIDDAVAAGRREERAKLRNGALPETQAAWDADKTEIEGQRDGFRAERDTLQRIVDEYDRQTDAELATALRDLPAVLRPFVPAGTANGVQKRLFLMQVSEARGAMAAATPTTTTTARPPVPPIDPARAPGLPSNDDIEALAAALPRRL